MKVTVVFITCGIHDYIEQAFHSLVEYTPDDCQVIVLQNNYELPYEIPKKFIVLNSNEYLGIVQARMKCWEYVDGDIVIWHDDDVTSFPDYVDWFIQPFKEIPHDVVMNDGYVDEKKKIGKFTSVDEIAIVGYEAAITSDMIDDQWFINPREIEADYFDPPYAVRKDVVDKIGGYDTLLGKYTCDGNDLCLGIQSKGWKLFPIGEPDTPISYPTLDETFNMTSKEREESAQRFLDLPPYKVVHYREKTRYALGINILRDWDYEFGKSRQRMLQKHHNGNWRALYGMAKEPFIVHPGLQFPALRGRIGGPKDIRMATPIVFEDGEFQW